MKRILTAAFCLGLVLPLSSLRAAEVGYIDIAQVHEYQYHNIYEPEQLLKGHVSLTGTSGRHSVILLWRDSYGRIAGADTVTVSAPLAGAGFSIRLENSLSYYNYIEAVVDGVAQREKKLFLIRPPIRKWDDFYTAVWAGYRWEHFPKLREAGINTHMVFRDFPYFEQVMAQNFDTYVDNILWRVFAPYHKWRWRWNSIKELVARDPYNQALLTRVPPFEDPGTDQAMKTTLQRVVEYHKPHRPLFYNMADEIGTGDQSGPIDFDHSIYARNEFIEYLKRKYITIEAVNEKWGTDFPSIYAAARSTLTLTDATMDRIWKQELTRQFATPSAAAERFGLSLDSFEGYVELNAALKSTPPRSAGELERQLPHLKRQFGLENITAAGLVSFAGKFHEWTTSLSIPVPAGWNLSPWMDHKDFMDRSIADALRRAREFGREADSEGVFGFTGNHSPGAFAGYNLEYMSRVVDLAVPYDLAMDKEIIRSLNKDLLLMTPTWGSDERGVRALWYQFFHQDHGVIFWDNDEPGLNFVDKATGELADRAKVFAPDLNEIIGGLGRLVLNSRRLHDRVAVLYSHPSIRAHWMIQHLGKGREWITRSSANEYRELYPNQLRLSLLQMIEDHFLQYDFVSYVQVREGLLDKGEYGLLFLPQSVALSDEEVTALERFVAAGGTLVGDCRIGLMDGDGRSRERGALDHVFGIRQTGQSDGLRNVVEAAGAKQATLGGSRVLVNGFGRGTAIYLDRVIDDYHLLRLGPGRDQALFELFGALFERSGIRPAARVTLADGSRLPGTEMVRYSNGDQELLALFRNPLTRRIGIGGSEAIDNSAFERAEKVRIRLPAARNVYDLRSGRDYGRTREVEFDLDPWRPTVLTLADRTVTAFRVTGPSHPVKAGSPAEFRISLDSPPALVDNTVNVVSVRVTGPDGKRLHHYERNLRFVGNSSGYALNSAINESPGTYGLTFTHAATGKKQDHTVIIVD